MGLGEGLCLLATVGVIDTGCLVIKDLMTTGFIYIISSSELPEFQSLGHVAVLGFV